MSRGVVVSLQFCPGHRLPMEKRERLRALENLGMQGDRHAIPDGKRQVLFMESETLARLGIEAGDVKENITTKGIRLMELPLGSRLSIGEAEFQLTKPCEPCSMMDEIRMGLREQLEGQRGMLARVVRGAEIRVGDEIRLIEHLPVSSKQDFVS